MYKVKIKWEIAHKMELLKKLNDITGALIAITQDHEDIERLMDEDGISIEEIPDDNDYEDEDEEDEESYDQPKEGWHV